jgi:hypothetical protein
VPIPTDNPGEDLDGARQKILSVESWVREARRYHNYKPYARAHLRKIGALCDEVLSELDFVEFAYKEGR